MVQPLGCQSTRLSVAGRAPQLACVGGIYDSPGALERTRLESSNVRTPSAFFAAQSGLGAKARFSTLSVAELLDPSQASTKEDLEVHPLSPKGWFKRNDFSSSREFNQVANLALVE